MKPELDDVQREELRRWRNEDWDLQHDDDPDCTSDTSLIAIGGCGRSGTTLMRVMLDTHSQIASGPESLLFLPTAIDRDVLAGKFDLEPDDVQRMLDESDSRTAFIEKFQAAYTDSVGKTTWADKTARNIHRILHIFQHFPNAKFLHIVRDGRDVISSLLTHRKRRLVAGEIELTGYQMPLENCIERWRKAIEDCFAHRGDPRYCEVQYQDLVVDTRTALQQVCEFLKVPFEEEMLDFHTVQTPSRDAKKFVQNVEATKPVTTNPLGRWRRDLSHEQQVTVHEGIHDLLETMEFNIGKRVNIIDSEYIDALLREHPTLVKETTKASLAHHASDEIVQPPKVYLKRSPESHTADRTIAMPVHVNGDSPAQGMKWIGSSPNNFRRGLPRANALIILNDPVTNAPIAVMDGTTISSLRTMAMSQIAIDRFHPEPKTIGILGMGKLGMMHAQTLPEQYDSIESVLCYSSGNRELEGLPERSTQQQDLQALLDASDVIITSTAANEPYISHTQIQHPSLIVNLSLMDLDMSVFENTGTIVVDDWGQCSKAEKVFKQAVDQGRITQEDVIEISDVLFGERQDDQFHGQVLVNPLGMAVEDIVVAQRIFDLLPRKAQSTMLQMG